MRSNSLLEVRGGVLTRDTHIRTSPVGEEHAGAGPRTEGLAARDRLAREACGARATRDELPRRRARGGSTARKLDRSGGDHGSGLGLRTPHHYALHNARITAHFAFTT